jgi:NAD(P)-dependent dehydrogenase (short-subunit alcohol dehydrogenase family)
MCCVGQHSFSTACQGMPSLQKQVVIVTGASSGIGEATVRRLVRAGAKVILTARRAERLAALCAEVDPAGGNALSVPGDVTQDADRRRIIAETHRRFGRIDALVNNAGYGYRGPVECAPVGTIRENFETNFFSLVALTQLVIPVMRAQGRGRIVNISSVAGCIARPMSSVYDATKHALEAVSAGLRGELAPFGLQVVVVRPGFILTEFPEASNRVSAQVLGEAEVYEPYARWFRARLQQVKRIAAPPDCIAQLVERALVAKHPKNYYSGPLHARLFLFLNWALPSRTIDWLLGLKKAE